jgi:hypothetical protein
MDGILRFLGEGWSHSHVPILAASQSPVDHMVQSANYLLSPKSEEYRLSVATYTCDQPYPSLAHYLSHRKPAAVARVARHSQHTPFPIPRGNRSGANRRLIGQRRPAHTRNPIHPPVEVDCDSDEHPHRLYSSHPTPRYRVAEVYARSAFSVPLDLHLHRHLHMRASPDAASTSH